MRRGSKGIHPGVRPDGKNSFIVRVTVTNEGGDQKEREKRVNGTLTEAIRLREDLREELQREFADEAKLKELGLERANTRHETLTDYAKRWLEHVEKSGRNRKHVVDQHTEILERFILPRLGRMEVRQIRRRDLVMWMEGLGELRTKSGEQYAKLTLHGAWATLRCMLKNALVLCDLKEDVTAGVRFHARGKEAVEKDVLTREELGRLLIATEAENPDMRAMIWVGFTTGMRFGELSALQWDDIDFGRGLIHVRKSQVKGRVGPTKTRSRRTVPLHPVVADLLREHREWQRQKEIPGLESGFLFLPTKMRTAYDDEGNVLPVDPKQTRLRYSNVLSKPLKRCADAAEVKKHVTAHTMRRTFNNLARQAAGEIVARSMTGHTTTAMTEHYSHVTLEEKNRAVSVALGLLDTKGSTGTNPRKLSLEPQSSEESAVRN